LIKDLNENHFQIIKDLCEELLEFYNDNDWLVVKKYIVRYSHPDVRKHFSTRHPKTKKHILNNFEKSLVNYIKLNYNKELILYEKDKHKP